MNPGLGFTLARLSHSSVLRLTEPRSSTDRSRKRFCQLLNTKTRSQIELTMESLEINRLADLVSLVASKL